MSYRLAPSAFIDLAEIRDYLDQQSPTAADRLLQRVERRCESLAIRPYQGRPRDDLRRGLRQVLVPPYILVYRVTEQGRVEIVRIVHGRRHLKDV